jgi:hypothetical protein
MPEIATLAESQKMRLAEGAFELLRKVRPQSHRGLHGMRLDEHP